MLIFVGQRPSFSPSFFASSLSTFVSMFLINSLSSFCSIDNRRVIGIGKNKVYYTNVNGGRVFSECSSIYTHISSVSRGTHVSGHAPGTDARQEEYHNPPPVTGWEGDPPSSLSPQVIEDIFDIFSSPLLRSSERQTPPTRSDQDPIRDRVRGPEYDDQPPTSEHLRGYPHPVPVLRLLRGAHPGNHRFVCKTRGYPPLVP